MATKKFDTRDVERALLKILCTNKIMSKLYVYQVRDEWFQGTRRELFLMFRRMFEDTSSVMTDKLLRLELDKNPTSRQAFETEWELIKNIDVQETPEALIEKLQEKQLIETMSRICADALSNIENGQIDEAVRLMKTEAMVLGQDSEDKPLIDLFDIEDRARILKDKQAHPELYRGIPTGFPTFDKMTGGLFNAEMTLFSGISGTGKSTLLKQIGYNAVMFANKKILHVTNEEHRNQVELKYDALFSDIDYFKFKVPSNMSQEDFDKWVEIMNARRATAGGRIFIKEIPQFANCSEIYRVFMELDQRGNRPDLIILDYMDHLSPIKKPLSENDEQAKVAADCKGVAIDFNIPLVTVTQAATIVDKKQEKGRKFGKMDVYGSKRRVHAANTLGGIMLGGQDDMQQDRSEYLRDRFWTIHIVKNRDGPEFSFQTRHRVKVGRVVEEKWSLASTGFDDLTSELESPDEDNEGEPQENSSGNNTQEESSELEDGGEKEDVSSSMEEKLTETSNFEKKSVGVGRFFKKT